MQTTRSIAFVFLLLTGACASTPGLDPVERRVREAENQPIRGGIAEFRFTSYDGHRLKGRVLLGATVDPLVIDGRLFEGADVKLEKVRACGKTEMLDYLMADLHSWPREDDIISLRRGYWYGFNVSFFLFNKETGLGPDCFEADLVLHVLDGRSVATLPIRVVRTDKPPAPPAGSAEEPRPPPADDGAP